MSEVEKEILDLLILNGRKPQTIKSGERVVYLYDALNIVNKEFSKIEQPQLNENQQIVLEKLKRLLVDYDVYNANPFETIYCFVDDYGTEKYYENLTAKQEVQVLQVFIQWALEQEE